MEWGKILKKNKEKEKQEIYKIAHILAMSHIGYGIYMLRHLIGKKEADKYLNNTKFGNIGIKDGAYLRLTIEELTKEYDEITDEFIKNENSNKNK